MIWVVLLVGLLLLIGRLALVWVRYRRIKAAGHDVRWEWPLARAWRKAKASRSTAER